MKEIVYSEYSAYWAGTWYKSDSYMALCRCLHELGCRYFLNLNENRDTLVQVLKSGEEKSTIIHRKEITLKINPMTLLTSDKEYLYSPDGTQKEIFPKNGSYYELEELQQLVGGNIELLYSTSSPHRVMVIDEEGKLKGEPLNMEATHIAYSEQIITPLDYIVGKALYINSKSIQ